MDLPFYTVLKPKFNIKRIISVLNRYILLYQPSFMYRFGIEKEITLYWLEQFGKMSVFWSINYRFWFWTILSQELGCNLWIIATFHSPLLHMNIIFIDLNCVLKVLNFNFNFNFDLNVWSIYYTIFQVHMNQEVIF